MAAKVAALAPWARGFSLFGVFGVAAQGWMQSLNFCPQMTADEHSIHCKVL